ncbi:MAG: hypothetical protein AB7L65_10810 [Hyphomonadaceae bacterium]
MNEKILDQGREVLERAEGAVHDALETTSEAAKDGLDAAHAFLVKQAKERPLATVGAAAGIGLLLGLLLAGGRRD